MVRDPFIVLVQLGAAGGIAFAAIWLLLRISTPARQTSVVLGYPPSLFPLRELTHSSPLAALAATQQQLLGIYEQAPPESDLAIWLGQFLPELRAVMDSAYQAAVASRAYGNHVALDRLANEVQIIGAQLSTLAVEILLRQPSGAAQAGLDERLAVLRMCADQLALAAPLAAAQAEVAV